MQFHELSAFVTLASTLHFARAAAVLNSSPSALSRVISRLEEELGTRLFVRDTRRATLTREGELFLDFARESLRRREELDRELQCGDQGLRGQLRVFASVTACYSILPPFVALLSAEHPGLRLSVQTGDPAEAAAAVRAGQADLAVAALPEEGFADLDSYSVRRSPLVFTASQDGPFGHLELDEDGSASDAAELDLRLQRVLAQVPLILPHAGLARKRFDRWARERSIHPVVAAETAGNEALLALARLGLGVALVPRLVLENGPFAAGLRLYAAAPEFGDYDIGFVLRPERSGGDYHRRLHAALAGLLARLRR